MQKGEAKNAVVGFRSLNRAPRSGARLKHATDNQPRGDQEQRSQNDAHLLASLIFVSSATIRPREVTCARTIAAEAGTCKDRRLGRMFSRRLLDGGAPVRIIWTGPPILQSSDDVLKRFDHPRLSRSRDEFDAQVLAGLFGGEIIYLADQAALAT